MPGLIDRTTATLCRVGATDAEVTVAQMALSFLNPQPNLFACLGSAPAATQAVPWALEVTRQHQRVGQPVLNQAFATVRTALRSVETLPSPDTPTARKWRTWLQTLENSLESGVPTPREVLPEVLVAEQLTKLATLSGPDVARVARELAVVLSELNLTDGEYASLLSAEAGSVRGWAATSLLSGVTAASPRQFVVLIGLTGVAADPHYSSNFNSGGLHYFDPARKGAYAKWRGAGGAVAETVRALGQYELRLPHFGIQRRGPSLLLEGVYSARWESAALREASKDAERLAARIALAHPRAGVDLFPIVLVTDQNRGKLSVHDTTSPRLGELRLAAPNWTSLTEAQEAHLRARGPSNDAHRTSLSWVSLEVLGVAGGFGPASVTLVNLSKALALHRLRQLVTFSYRTLISTIAANTDESTRLFARAADIRRGSRKRETQAAGLRAGLDPHYLQAARFRMLASLYSLQGQRTRKQVEDLQEAIRIWGLSPATEKNMTRMVYLADAPTWIDNLRGDSAELRRFSQVSPAATRNLLNEACRVVADQSAVQSYLASAQEWLAQQLRNLYVARNMHLHAGLSDFPGDRLLAEFGAHAVDSLYEILDLWPNMPNDDADSVQAVLARVAHTYDAIASSTRSIDLRAYIDVMLTPAGLAATP